MKRIRIVLLSIGLFLFLVGSSACGSKVVKEFEELRDEMCACKDRECAQTVKDKFEEWHAKNKKAKGSQGQKDKANKVSAEFNNCMIAAFSGNPGAAKPDGTK